ncbi:alpha/beta fold hydrolase [Herbaspirillum lusitanum]|uniref:alpha/beta fold hydrolase n=1 Tax=Herbaspirillum lusitanum TaxID=213312 RepID=UPI00036A6F27
MFLILVFNFQEKILISAYADFDKTFPFAPHFQEVNGFQMHYVDEGDRSREVVLCLHGEPTWGYLFRSLITALRSDYRVVVPDHMGFGKSETPQDRSYWLQDHIDNLEKLVLQLDLKEITLVMHDFGGPVGMGLAARHPGRIKRIISTNGPTPFGHPDGMERLMENAAIAPWFQWIVKANEDGSLEQVLGQLGFNILSTMKINGFENHGVISDTWISAYGAHFATPGDCLGAIGWAKGFATGAHQFEVPDAAAIATIRSQPALAIWGDADKTLHPPIFLPLFTSLFPVADVRRLPEAGHYCFEDAPDEIAGIVRRFLKNS